MLMAKAWGSIGMADPYKKSRAPTAKNGEQRIVYASRVVPFRFAFAGFHVISLLPTIFVLPQEGADIEMILKKRNRVLIEIIKELQELDS